MFKLIYRVLIVALSIIGLIAQMYPNKYYNLTYYTTQSSILVMLFFAYTIYLMRNQRWNRLRSSTFLRLKGGVTIMITLTFLVYAILLAPQVAPEDFHTINNYTLHYIVPVMVIVDWLTWDKGWHYRMIEPLTWAIVPIAYLIFSLVKGYLLRIPIPDAKHSPYPYFFLNVDKYGWSTVLMYIAGIAIFYISYGYLMLAVKKIQVKFCR